jgi:Uma2 family endonuclease
VVEVVSADPKDRERDLEEKRREYAPAGFPEYWIVDPEAVRIMVLKLEGEQSVPHAEASTGERDGSAPLPGFELEADSVFAAATFPH